MGEHDALLATLGTRRQQSDPLLSAAKRGHEDVMQVFLRHLQGATDEGNFARIVNATDRLNGKSALSWAVERRHPEIVRLLLETGHAEPAANLLALPEQLSFDIAQLLLPASSESASELDRVERTFRN